MTKTMKNKTRHSIIFVLLSFGIINFGIQLWYHVQKDFKLSTKYYTFLSSRSVPTLKNDRLTGNKDSLNITTDTPENESYRMYYPGQNIPEMKTRIFQEKSHEILKRKITSEEYKAYKDLVFDTVEIFRRNNIR